MGFDMAAITACRRLLPALRITPLLCCVVDLMLLTRAASWGRARSSMCVVGSRRLQRLYGAVSPPLPAAAGGGQRGTNVGWKRLEGASSSSALVRAAWVQQATHTKN